MTDGSEWVVDARGCDAALISDLATMRQLFAVVVDELHLSPVADAIWHAFPPPGGITGLVPLAESHLTVHTFPEYGSVCINLFCCKRRTEWPWAQRLRERLGATDVRVRQLERRYTSVVRKALAPRP